MDFSSLNYLGIAVAVIAQMALGFFWYSPKGFGTKWMSIVGLTMEDANRDGNKAMLKGVALTIFGTVFLAMLLDMLNPSGIQGALSTGLVIAFATLIPSHLGRPIWEQKPIDIFYINGGYYTLALLIASVILVTL